MTSRPPPIRSAETRDRLRQAVVTAIFEHGYAGATMTRIARAAGLTRGAIQHHFGDRRIDMVADVCEHILAKRQAAYDERAAQWQNDDSDHSRAAMKAAYRDPETWFLIEVWIASKSDADLRIRIADILGRVNDPSDARMSQLLGLHAGSGRDFRVHKYFLRSLTRGLALEFSGKPDPDLFDDVVDLAFDLMSGSVITMEEADE